jgi:glycerol-3-phosphate cytidylyltransferase-like family protein
VLVYTGGTFDRLHEGHRDLLAYCRALASGGATARRLLPDRDRLWAGGGAVVVGLNRDEFVPRYKGRATAQGYEVRAAALAPFVDLVIPNVGDEDSRRAIDAVQPDIVLIGSDWHARDYLGQLGLDFDWLHERRIVLGYAPRPSGGPSTSGTWA